MQKSGPTILYFYYFCFLKLIIQQSSSILTNYKKTITKHSTQHFGNQ